MNMNTNMNTSTMSDSNSIKQNIYTMIYEYHDPSLVEPNESPNNNIIHHLYINGKITYQKGGWAYLQRSEFVLFSAISKDLKLDNAKFMNKNNYNYNYNYIIVTLENANKIRDEMLKL